MEYVTLSWNVIGVVVLAVTAITARSVALAGFGLDSLIEIGASAVVVWALSGTGVAVPSLRRRLGLFRSLVRGWVGAVSGRSVLMIVGCGELLGCAAFGGDPTHPVLPVTVARGRQAGSCCRLTGPFGSPSVFSLRKTYPLNDRGTLRPQPAGGVGAEPLTAGVSAGRPPGQAKCPRGDSPVTTMVLPADLALRRGR